MAGPVLKDTRAYSEDVKSHGGDKSIRQSPFASKDTSTGYKPGADCMSQGKFEVDRAGGKDAQSLVNSSGKTKGAHGFQGK